MTHKLCFESGHGRSGEVFGTVSVDSKKVILVLTLQMEHKRVLVLSM